MNESAVLLLPGLLCDAAAWESQCATLAMRAACIVPDYGALSSITAMAQAVLAAAPSSFALAGHSMGGRVALEVARLAPQRVRRFALLDSGVDPVAPGDAGATERRNRLALLALAEQHGMRTMGRQWARGMVHPDRIDTPLFDAIVDMIERKSTSIFAAQIRALLDRPDARATWSSLRVPTLLVCGRQDAWSPLARHEQMQAMLPGSRLAVVEESGHMTTMEQPRVVSQALLDWLDA